jgi:hypothetical protein
LFFIYSLNSGQGHLKFDASGVSTKYARVAAMSSNVKSASTQNEIAIIHTGIKNYWRINTNVEFHFVEHVSYDVIEIIAYKPDTEEEAPRLYLSFSKVLGKCSQEDILTRLNTRREDHIRKKIPIVNEELEAFAKHAAISQYILARVVVDPMCMQPDVPFMVNFAPIMGKYYEGL